MNAETSIEIRDERDEGRYSAYANGRRIGYATWVKVHDTVVLPHTEVDPAWNGKGIGSMIARRAFEDARADGLTVLPFCPFMKRWADLHPAFRDIVRTSRPGERLAIDRAVHAARTLEALSQSTGTQPTGTQSTGTQSAGTPSAGTQPADTQPADGTDRA